jgi:serine/threonine protein kinase
MKREQSARRAAQHGEDPEGRRAQRRGLYSWRRPMIGRTLEHYQIEGPLGAGGMGVVYKARDPRLDRHVAIKVLPPEKITDPRRGPTGIRTLIDRLNSVICLSRPRCRWNRKVSSLARSQVAHRQCLAGITEEGIPVRGFEPRSRG